MGFREGRYLAPCLGLIGGALGELRECTEMAEYGDGGLILWDGESRGTLDMIDKLRRLGKPVEMKWAICIELEGDCSDLVAPKVENLPCVVRED